MRCLWPEMPRRWAAERLNEVRGRLRAQGLSAMIERLDGDVLDLSPTVRCDIREALAQPVDRARARWLLETYPHVLTGALAEVGVAGSRELWSTAQNRLTGIVQQLLEALRDSPQMMDGVAVKEVAAFTQRLVTVCVMGDEPTVNGRGPARRDNRQAALLGALALAGGNPVPDVLLAQELWGDGPRNLARLRKTVQRVRETYGPCVVSAHRAYALDLSHAQADLHVWQRQVALLAAQRLAGADVTRAAGMAALSLVGPDRGLFLAGPGQLRACARAQLRPYLQALLTMVAPEAAAPLSAMLSLLA